MSTETQENLSPEEVVADIDLDLDLDDDKQSKVSEDDQQAQDSEDDGPEGQEASDEDGAAQDEESSGDEDELEGQSERVKKRINKLTFEKHEAAREALAYRAKLAAQEERMGELADRLAQIETAGDQANEEKIDERVQTLRANLETAIEDGDTKAQATLTEQLLDARVDQREAHRRRQYLENRAKQKAAQPAQSATPAEHPLATNWKIENSSWFGQKDFEDKTRAALLIDKQVEADGFDMRSQEYYNEVDRRLAKAFPEDGRGSKPSRPGNSPVLPAKRGGPMKQGLRMDANEIRVGQSLGLDKDPKSWAAYKKEVQAARKEKQKQKN